LAIICSLLIARLFAYIIDTENLHKQSVAEVVAKFGKTYNLDLRYRVLGTPEQDGAKMVVNELKLPISIEEYSDMVRAYENKVLSDVPLLPGSYYFLVIVHCRVNVINRGVFCKMKIVLSTKYLHVRIL